MTSAQITAIGVGQCISWGILYYAFGVLQLPVAADLGVETWQLNAAFSLALLSSACVAPTIGRLADRGRGPVVMQAGGLIAAGLLAGWAWVPSVTLSYLTWTGLGVCMAAILYEPIFTIVGRAILDSGQRIRALATITVWGGLASTVFLPLTAWLIGEIGWRLTVVVFAGGLAAVTIGVRHYAFNHLTGTRSTAEPAAASAAGSSTFIWILAVTFSCISLASAGLAITLIPALVERGFTSTTAAWVASLFGVMQLPGRLLVMRGYAWGPVQLLWTSLTLMIAGLLIISAVASVQWSAVGVALFAAGSGLATISRPYLVLESFGSGRSGDVNGVIARLQQLTRAAGPISASFFAAIVGYSIVFASLAALLAVTGIILSLMTLKTGSEGSERSRSEGSNRLNPNPQNP